MLSRSWGDIDFELNAIKEANMDRHLLIAISEHKSSLLGVRFVGNFFSDKRQLKSTLFYSSPKPASIWAKEIGSGTIHQQKEQENWILAKGKLALEDARNECINLGFLPENLSLKLETQVFSTITDIIREGKKGKYDAVVLGRRGLSMLGEAFEEKISKDLFNTRFTFPIWLCRSSNPVKKNVLLYLDGSETSFRMADHVGHVLSLEKKHRLDILISDKDAQEESIMKKCKTILSGHQFPEGLIRQQTTNSENVAKVILDAVEKEQYATVALGRSGQKRNPLLRLFKGPVCSVLFKELKDTSLWICH